MSRTKIVLTLLVVCSLLAAAPARAQIAAPELPLPYTDIATHWSRDAIVAVAVDQNWLRISGTRFGPDVALNRAVFAFGLVRAFALDVPVDPKVTFSDVPVTSWVYRYANVAVRRGWIRAPGGVFSPTASVTKAQLNYALVRATGLGAEATGVAAMRDASGYRFRKPSPVPYSAIAHQMRLHYNFPNSMRYELLPGSRIKRGEFAHALRAAGALGWRARWLERFRSITLPTLTPTRRKVVEFALRQIGTPYTWGGTSPSGGMDCSGFVWWVLRSGMGNDRARGYTGWSLPQRSSYDMARATRTRIDITRLRPLDLLFWDVEGPFTRAWNTVGHAGIYLGNGWFIHSSGGRAGVTLDHMGDGYWRERFVWGRRIVPSTV